MGQNFNWETSRFLLRLPEILLQTKTEVTPAKGRYQTLYLPTNFIIFTRSPVSSNVSLMAVFFKLSLLSFLPPGRVQTGKSLLFIKSNLFLLSEKMSDCAPINILNPSQLRFYMFVHKLLNFSHIFF